MCVRNSVMCASVCGTDVVAAVSARTAAAGLNYRWVVEHARWERACDAMRRARRRKNLKACGTKRKTSSRRRISGVSEDVSAARRRSPRSRSPPRAVYARHMCTHSTLYYLCVANSSPNASYFIFFFHISLFLYVRIYIYS